MASEVDIVNAGFRLVGEKPIASLEDNTPRAKAAKLLWPIVRDAQLRLHPWSFAMEQRKLAKALPEPEFEFDNQLTGPSI